MLDSEISQYTHKERMSFLHLVLNDHICLSTLAWNEFELTLPSLPSIFLKRPETTAATIVSSWPISTAPVSHIYFHGELQHPANSSSNYLEHHCNG